MGQDTDQALAASPAPKAPYAPPAVLWEEAFVALAAGSAPPIDPPKCTYPGQENCTP